MKEFFAVIAVILSIIGNIPYLRDVIQKRVEPHPYTWLVWTIVSGVTLAGLIVKGAGIGAIPVAVSECFTFIIFIFALKYGFKNIQRKDTYFLLIALAGLIPWVITSDPTLSIIIVVSIDAVAFIPTIRKTWRKPKTETSMLYSMNVLRHICILFSLGSYNIATMFHSIVMIMLNAVMTMLILRRVKGTPSFFS